MSKSNNHRSKLLALLIINCGFILSIKPIFAQKQKLITNPQNNHRYEKKLSMNHSRSQRVRVVYSFKICTL